MSIDSIDLLESLHLHNTSHQGVTETPGPQRLKAAYSLQGECVPSAQGRKELLPLPVSTPNIIASARHTYCTIAQFLRCWTVEVKFWRWWLWLQEKQTSRWRPWWALAGSAFVGILESEVRLSDVCWCVWRREDVLTFNLAYKYIYVLSLRFAKTMRQKTQGWFLTTWAGLTPDKFVWYWAV